MRIILIRSSSIHIVHHDRSIHWFADKSIYFFFFLPSSLSVSAIAQNLSIKKKQKWMHHLLVQRDVYDLFLLVLSSAMIENQHNLLLSFWFVVLFFLRAEGKKEEELIASSINAKARERERAWSKRMWLYSSHDRSIFSIFIVDSCFDREFVLHSRCLHSVVQDKISQKNRSTWFCVCPTPWQTNWILIKVYQSNWSLLAMARWAKLVC